MLAWPSHSWTLVISAPRSSALVAAVARSEWTQKPGTYRKVAALAMDPQMRHPPAQAHVLNLQHAQLLSPEPIYWSAGGNPRALGAEIMAWHQERLAAAPPHSAHRSRTMDVGIPTAPAYTMMISAGTRPSLMP